MAQKVTARTPLLKDFDSVGVREAREAKERGIQ